jgi:two-component system, response regulator FlrC
VAATNVNLQEEIKHQRFREDLYYRLSAFKFNMPRLAKRPLDIKPLACLMIQKYSTSAQLPELSECAVDKLLKHSWPGNIRELENVISRALILSDTNLMTAEDMVFDGGDETDPISHSFATESAANHGGYGSLPSEAALSESVRNVEFRSILSALRASRTRAGAAKQLGISQRTLRHKLQMYRVDGHHVPDAYAR